MDFLVVTYSGVGESIDGNVRNWGSSPARPGRCRARRIHQLFTFQYFTELIPTCPNSASLTNGIFITFMLEN